MNSKYNHHSKLFWRRNFYHLEAPKAYWSMPNHEHKTVCNGVGSKIDWWNTLLWHLTPNTCWFLSIEQSADIHDYDYTFPQYFRTMEEAIKYKIMVDNRFRENCFRQIEMGTKSEYLKYLRRSRVEKYHLILIEIGNKSFLKGKTIGG